MRLSPVELGWNGTIIVGLNRKRFDDSMASLMTLENRSSAACELDAEMEYSPFKLLQCGAIEFLHFKSDAQGNRLLVIHGRTTTTAYIAEDLILAGGERRSCDVRANPNRDSGYGQCGILTRRTDDEQDPT